MVRKAEQFARRTRGLIPLPPGDIPEDTQCVMLCIPNDPAYKRQLAGMLLEFTHWNAYERDPTHKAALVAAAWSKAIMEGMLNCYQFRNQGGQLQFSSDGGATWSGVPTTAPGPETFNPRNDGTIQPHRTGSNIPCLAARNAEECIHQLHSYMVNWYDNWGTALTIAQLLMGIIAAFFPMDWPLALAIIAYSGLCTSMLALSDALNTGTYDSTVTEFITCLLYCYADSNGQWSQSHYDLMMLELGAKTEHIYQLIYLWLDQCIGRVGLNNAGTTTSIASYDCGACVCGWCMVFEGTAWSGSWSTDGAGQFEGNGWGDTYIYSYPCASRAAYLVYAPGAAFELTYLKVSWTLERGNASCSGNPGDITQYNASDVQFLNRVDGSPNGSYETVWTGDVTMEELYVQMRCGTNQGTGDPGGSTLIWRVELHGKGDKPETGYDCP